MGPLVKIGLCSTVPRHKFHFTPAWGTVEHFNRSYIFSEFLQKKLRPFKRIMSQLYRERMNECKKSRKLQIKTASSFNRWESQSVPLCPGLPYLCAMRKSQCSAVPRSPILVCDEKVTVFRCAPVSHTCVRRHHFKLTTFVNNYYKVIEK